MTLRRAWVAGWLAALAAAPALAASTAQPLSFAGVELGTSEAAWRAGKPPGPTSDHARHACSDDGGLAAAQLADRALPKDAVVCGIVDIYGRFSLPVTFNWSGRYSADHVRFTFLHGRLSEIRARLSRDAFDALMAEFRRSYGPPSRTIRDTLRTEIGPMPRVTVTWALPQGRIRVVDPIPSGQLSVQLTAAGAKAP